MKNIPFDIIEAQFLHFLIFQLRSHNQYFHQNFRVNEQNIDHFQTNLPQFADFILHWEKRFFNR
jgi:hypothetical protein